VNFRGERAKREVLPLTIIRSIDMNRRNAVKLEIGKWRKTSNGETGLIKLIQWDDSTVSVEICDRNHQVEWEMNMKLEEVEIDE
jgi:hypothetical protein